MIFRFLVCLFLFVTHSINAIEDSRSRYVLVSVAPHKFFVEKIAGDTLRVGVMVPAGASFHTYEPTPKAVIAASQADLWFMVGESFEARASQALIAHNPRLKLIDLRQGIHLISYNDSNPRCCHHHDSSYDLHFWLSPKEGKTQAKVIAEALATVYPEQRELFYKNLKEFLLELDDLDQKIAQILRDSKDNLIMVSHPAYAYFVRDYHLHQLSIEFEGKDPTPQQLTNILNTARKSQLTRVYIQPQYNNKGARLIADELGAKVIVLDPYSENYDTTLLEIARNFANH
jgi:zinc transport system substrate-binding protein